MTISEDLEALELFNRKAETLRNSRFMKSLLERGSGVTISGDKDGRITTETRWPDQEAIEAFILTLRFFIQNNEKSSFENMEKTYDNLPISQEKKELFKNARKKLNEFLDSNSPLGINEQFLTHRRILWVFVYGEFAHTDKELKPIYDQWMSYGIFNVTIYNEFIYVLGMVTSFIAYVQNLNEEVIKELGEKE